MQRLFARSVSGRRLLVFVVLVVLVGCVVGDAGAGVGRGGGGSGAAVAALVGGDRGRLALGLVAPAEQLLCASADRVGEVRSDRCGRVVVGVGRREAVRRRLSAGVVRSLVRASALADPVVSVGTTPTGVAVSATRAYVANQGSNNVSVIDLTQSPPVVSATVAVGSAPDAAALSADGTRLYVPNFRGGTLSIVSTTTNTVTQTVPVGSRPDGVLEVAGAVYVANLLSGTISVIDPAAGTVTGTISLPGAGTSTGVAPSGLAASAGGQSLYANDARNGRTYVIDLTQSPPAVTGSAAVGSFPAYLSVAGSRGYVANPGSNSISVLDLSQSPPLPVGSVGVGTAPYGVLALPALGEVLSTNSGSNTVSVIDTSSAPGTVVSTVPVGTTPDAIAVSPDQGTVVVSNEASNSVSIFHVNQAPLNTVPGAQTVAYNPTAALHHQLTFSSANGNQISSADSDAASSAVKMTLGVAHGALTLAGTSGLSFTSGDGTSDAALVFTGALGDVNAALAGLIYEPATSFQGADTLTVTDDDQGNSGLGKAQATPSTLPISVTDSAPTDIALSASSVAENQPVGTTVGAFSTTDPDAGDSFGYSLAGGTGSTDNGSFQVSGNTLQTAAGFDFEAKSSYSIRVRSTDAGGLLFEKVFT